VRNPRGLITVVMFLVVAAFAHADTVTYTFTGAGGEAGTDWTLVDPSGYIPDDTNVLSLLTESTDFYSMGVDYGPLIGIADVGEQSGDAPCTNIGTPCFQINMVITYNGGPFIIPFLFEGTDGTAGTFTAIADGSTLTVADTSAPEPASAIFMLSAIGLLGFKSVRRRLGIAGARRRACHWGFAKGQN
jgi:hypothetical protein